MTHSYLYKYWYIHTEGVKGWSSSRKSKQHTPVPLLLPRVLLPLPLFDGHLLPDSFVPSISVGIQSFLVEPEPKGDEGEGDVNQVPPFKIGSIIFPVDLGSPKPINVRCSDDHPG